LTTDNRIKSNVEGDERVVVEEEKDVVEDEVVTRMWTHHSQFHQHSLCEEMKLPTKDS